MVSLSHRSSALPGIIERLMEEEKEAAEAYRRKASQVEDPALRSVLLDQAAKRDQFYFELESELRELRSQNEITFQINAMFW